MQLAEIKSPFDIWIIQPTFSVVSNRPLPQAAAPLPSPRRIPLTRYAGDGRKQDLTHLYTIIHYFILQYNKSKPKIQ